MGFNSGFKGLKVEKFSRN